MIYNVNKQVTIIMISNSKKSNTWKSILTRLSLDVGMLWHIKVVAMIYFFQFFSPLKTGEKNFRFLFLFLKLEKKISNFSFSSRLDFLDSRQWLGCAAHCEVQSRHKWADLAWAHQVTQGPNAGLTLLELIASVVSQRIWLPAVRTWEGSPGIATWHFWGHSED